MSDAATVARTTGDTASESLPIVDISGLRSADLRRRQAVAQALGRACRVTGFFYVVNHGVPDELRRDVFDLAKRLFALSGLHKDEVAIARSTMHRGYVGFGAERLDETSVADHKEAFDIGLELPPDDPEILAGVPFRGPNLWPSALPALRPALLAYFDACDRLVRLIHRGLALDLGLDETWFDDKLQRPASVLRMLRYPPAGDAPTTGRFGAGQHTDYGTLTILANDDVPGLQVLRRDGRWLDAPRVDGAFLCNIGDCLMRWTNHVYVSTPHRVLFPATERYSVAFFGHGNPSARVESLPGCVAASGAAPVYPPITCGAYLLQRLTATFDHITAPADSAATTSAR